METAFLGLGSNLGDRRGNLLEALTRLAREGVAIVRVSSIYESEAVLVEDQPAFLNIVARVQVELPAASLLAMCLRVESQMGRVRRERWGPRNIDIDLLLYGTLKINEPGLAVPHPAMLERGFVMVPLAEIASEQCLPSGEQVGELVTSQHMEQVRVVFAAHEITLPGLPD